MSTIGLNLTKKEVGESSADISQCVRVVENQKPLKEELMGIKTKLVMISDKTSQTCFQTKLVVTHVSA
jgi:hypothetical protein